LVVGVFGDEASDADGAEVVKESASEGPNWRKIPATKPKAPSEYSSRSALRSRSRWWRWVGSGDWAPEDLRSQLTSLRPGESCAERKAHVEDR